MNISSVKPPKSASKRRNQEPEAARTKKLPGAAGRSAPITAAPMRSNRRQTASMARLTRLFAYQASIFGGRRKKLTTALCGQAREKGR